MEYGRQERGARGANPSPKKFLVMALVFILLLKTSLVIGVFVSSVHRYC